MSYKDEVDFLLSQLNEEEKKRFLEPVVFKKRCDLEPLRDIGVFDKKQIRNGSTKSYNPWDKIQLTKFERKGKSYEEIQAIKKERWERIGV